MLAPLSSFVVENAGVVPLERVIVYDVHSIYERPNHALIDLAGTIDTAVRPLLTVPPSGSLPADVKDADRWRGHLSLASHDLYDRPELRPEVLDYIRALDVAFPPRFTADVVALYQFEHPNWTGRWWQNLRWSHVRSWRLE